MTENHGIEPEELAEFYKDVMWDEFDTVVEDGSLALVAQTICGYQTKIKRGLKTEVEAAIREAPKVAPNVSLAADFNDSDDEDDDNDVGGPSGIGVNGGSSRGSGAAATHAADNAEEMEVDEGEKAADEEEDGWTTVKK